MERHHALNVEIRWFEANSRSHVAEADGRPDSGYVRANTLASSIRHRNSPFSHTAISVKVGAGARTVYLQGGTAERIPILKEALRFLR
jgi:hypothetical protein